MSSKEVKIKRIEPEKIETPEIKRPDYDYGYKDRPLNTKRQTYNNYLDSCTVSGSDANKTGAFDCSLSTITTVGNLKWRLSSNKLYIPATGTYMIIGSISYENGTNDERFVQVTKNGSGILSRYETPAQTFTSIVTTIGVVNLSEGDYLDVDGIQGDSLASLDIDTTLQVTKIS